MVLVVKQLQFEVQAGRSPLVPWSTGDTSWPDCLISFSEQNRSNATFLQITSNSLILRFVVFV